MWAAEQRELEEDGDQQSATVSKPLWRVLQASAFLPNDFLLSGRCILALNSILTNTPNKALSRKAHPYIATHVDDCAIVSAMRTFTASQYCTVFDVVCTI